MKYGIPLSEIVYALLEAWKKKKEKERPEKMFKEIMAENFSNLGKDLDT